MHLTNKEKVTALLKSLETRDPAPAAYIDPKKYVQHNPATEDGIAGLQKLFGLLPQETKVNFIRIFEEGNYVFAHVEYDFFGPKIAFEVFRFEDGLIVEHWDNLQETQPLNPSGRSMIDGATEVQDISSTEINKKIARNIVDDILVNGRLEKLAGYFNGDNYIQHNPWFHDKVSGLIKSLAELEEKGITMKYTQIHKVLGEGNFVLVISEGYLKEAHSAFYDLFRIENGKIAEHWDTIEAIPLKELHKNPNGKFQF